MTSNIREIKTLTSIRYVTNSYSCNTHDEIHVPFSKQILESLFLKIASENLELVKLILLM